MVPESHQTSSTAKQSRQRKQGGVLRSGKAPGDPSGSHARDRDRTPKDAHATLAITRGTHAQRQQHARNVRDAAGCVVGVVVAGVSVARAPHQRRARGDGERDLVGARSTHGAGCNKHIQTHRHTQPGPHEHEGNAPTIPCLEKPAQCPQAPPHAPNAAREWLSSVQASTMVARTKATSCSQGDTRT
jgi:hypothetical protein